MRTPNLPLTGSVLRDYDPTCGISLWLAYPLRTCAGTDIREREVLDRFNGSVDRVPAEVCRRDGHWRAGPVTEEEVTKFKTREVMPT